MKLTEILGNAVLDLHRKKLSPSYSKNDEIVIELVPKSSQ